MNRRLLWALWFALIPLAASGHIGNPNFIYEGSAGPYPVRVIIRTPGVVPGLADIHVRVLTNSVRQVSVLPVHWRAGEKGAPPPDLARPVAGETNLFNAQLWLMANGAYSVYVHLDGTAGRGTAIVPLNSIATRQLPMQSGLGIVLSVFGVMLFLIAVTIVGAATRESVLSPGVVPTARRRWQAHGSTGFAALFLITALWGGKHWWDVEDLRYRTKTMFKPLQVSATAPVENGERILRLVMDDSRWGTGPAQPLVPDHGKIMHLFLIREPALDAFAHLHPMRRMSNQFEVVLPPVPPGDYRVYADITQESGLSQTLTAFVKVPEAPPIALTGTPSSKLDPDDSWRPGPPWRAATNTVFPIGGGVIQWESAGALPAGREVELRFKVTGADGQPALLQPFMGMLSHAAFRREDGAVFTHLHPAGTISMAAQQVFQLRAQARKTGAISEQMLEELCRKQVVLQSREGLLFPCVFPEPGRYRLWVQVKIKGQIETGVFDVQVDAPP